MNCNKIKEEVNQLINKMKDTINWVEAHDEDQIAEWIEEGLIGKTTVLDVLMEDYTLVPKINEKSSYTRIEVYGLSVINDSVSMIKTFERINQDMQVYFEFKGVKYWGLIKADSTDRWYALEVEATEV